MFRCNVCGAIFDKPLEQRREVEYYSRPFGNESEPFGGGYYDCCPECESEDFDRYEEELNTLDELSVNGTGKISIEQPENRITFMKKPQDTKVIIWGYELCNGAEWKDFLDVVNKLGKEKAHLEAKLAESEKKFVIANNLRKNSDEVLLNYKTEKYGLDKTIQELRKMKLSLPEKEWYYKGFENCERQMSSHIADLTLEVKQLKQQLAEKDAEIEKWKSMAERSSSMLDRFNYCGESIVYNTTRDQDKISFAVEQLEKVKEKIYDFEYEDIFYFDKFIEYIDNRIKQLTHQHEDKGE